MDLKRKPVIWTPLELNSVEIIRIRPSLRPFLEKYQAGGFHSRAYVHKSLYGTDIQGQEHVTIQEYFRREGPWTFPSTTKWPLKSSALSLRKCHKWCLNLRLRKTIISASVCRLDKAPREMG